MKYFRIYTQKVIYAFEEYILEAVKNPIFLETDDNFCLTSMMAGLVIKLITYLLLCFSRYSFVSIVVGIKNI